MKNRSNATSNETDSAGNDHESVPTTTKQNTLGKHFFQAFGNIFNEMKGNSILPFGAYHMQQLRRIKMSKNQTKSILNSQVINMLWMIS